MPQLRQHLQQPELDEKERLRLSLALVAEDEGQVAYLADRLLTAEPAELLVIREALMPYRDKLVTEMWLAAEVSASARDRRLRALCALAAFDPASPRWTDAGKLAAEGLVAENPLLAATWVKALRPVRQSLLPGLQAVFHDRTRGDLQRSLATGILADYAAERPEVLADLLMDADDKQFAVIYPKLTELGEAGMPWLLGEVGKPMPDTDEEAKEVFAKRQANAAVALLKMNRPEKVWPLLKHGPDPRVRSYLIHRLAPLGADAGVVVRRLDSEPDLSIRRALLLALGEFQEADVPSEERESRLLKLREWYSTERDPGLHSAVEWLLRTWKEEAWLTLVNEKWARGQGTAGNAAGGHPAVAHEGKRENSSAVVRQWSGPDDGCRSRSGGVHDGIALHGGGQDRPRREAAQGADRLDVCRRCQAGDGGGVPQVRGELQTSGRVRPDGESADRRHRLVQGGKILQLVEREGGHT